MSFQKKKNWATFAYKFHQMHRSMHSYEALLSTPHIFTYFYSQYYDAA